MAEPAAARNQVRRAGARDPQLERWVAAACIAYAAIFVAARLATAPVLLADDAVALLQAQSWSLAPASSEYGSSQAPLYAWLFLAADLLLGNAMLAGVALKYACVAVALLLLFRAAVTTLGESILAAVATGSLLLSVDVAVEVHRDLTQGVLMLAAVGATWLALVPILLGRATTASFVLLGVAIGAGNLAASSYLVLALALALALVGDARARRHCADRRMVLVLAIAAAMLVPDLVALRDTARLTEALLRMPIAQRANALARLALAVVLAALPMAAFWWLLLRDGFRRGPARDADDALLERVLWRWLGITLALLVAGILGAGIGDAGDSAALALLAPAALLFFLRLRRANATAVQLRRFAWVIAAGALAGLLGTIGRVELEARSCAQCQALRDYRPAAQALARAGAGEALIVGDDREAIANLLVWLPEARGWAREDPPAAIPPDAAGRPCALVWGSAAATSSASPAPDWVRGLVRTPPGLSMVQNIASPMRALFGRAPRLFSLSFAVVPAGACVLPAR